ncbi:interleukin-1 receptor-associated kinase 1-like [Heterodontus francisci]|uniref:interleukin-1 receptor-associated kinase 1-like n=1 Tax=Heterodontus francisci TaxID=7792 RepID=UPI00355B2EDB
MVPVYVPPPAPLPGPNPSSAWSSPGKSRNGKPSEQATVTFDSPLPKPVLPRPPTPPDSRITDLCNMSFSSMDSLRKPPASPHPVSSPSMEKYLLYWPLHELKKGTNNFAERQKIGEGGFGCVYRALMRHTKFAVKRLKEDSDLDWKTVRRSFQTELEKLYQYRHPNIVGLAGCCVEDGVYCLVYMYMPNGSLQDRLQCQNNTSPLSWPRRLDVALGAACAIQFLHSNNPSVIHGDVKSSNILLDENFVPKLGDFGLAQFSRYSSNSGKSCTVARTQTLRGTLAYLPDEYIQSGQLTVELDTYSFGVVLLELLTGRKALETKGSAQSKYLKDIVKEEDGDADEESTGRTASIGRQSQQHVAARICQKHLDREAGGCKGHIPVQLSLLACECLNRKRKRRPKMTRVYEKLEELKRLAWPPASQGDQSLSGSSTAGSSDPASAAEPVDALADRLQRSSLSPVENTYRFASQSQAHGNAARSWDSPGPRYPPQERLSSYPSDSPTPPESGSKALETERRRGAGQSPYVSQFPQAKHRHGAPGASTSCGKGASGPLGAAGSDSSYSSLCQPVESSESSMDDGGGGSSTSSRRGCSSSFRPEPALSRPACAPGPQQTDSVYPSLGNRPGLPRPQALGDSRGAEAWSASAISQGSSSPSHQIVVNPAKQRILEQFALYNAGQIDSSELLSSAPRQGSCSRVERRGPEESDDFD